MATKGTTTRSTKAKPQAPRRRVSNSERCRAREVCPIPVEAVKVLEQQFRKFRGTKPTTVGWESSAPLVVSPSPAEGIEGAWFDFAAVVRVVDALCRFKHTKGRFARRALVPDAWQIVWVIAPAFGWKYSTTDPDLELAGTRIVRELYVEIPRKNGKSTLSSGLALVLLAADSEAGAEVYAAATTTDQARIVFDQSRQLLDTNRGLRDRLNSYKRVIEHPGTGGFYRVLSRMAEAAHGLNVHGAVIDELHIHKSRDLVDAILTGTGSRAQPMAIIITTADEGEIGTIYDEKHELVRKCANRIVRIEKFYGVIWAAEDADDPYDEKTWRKANPGLGVSPTLAYMRAEAAKARSTASYYPVFCRLHLNRRIRQQARFLNLADWDQDGNCRPVDRDELAGGECYGGLDLSATNDLTSFQLVFPDDDHEELTVLTHLWLPEHELKQRIERDQVPYDKWADAGYLTLSEGNVVDYSKVIEAIAAALDEFDLRAVHHDRWQAGAVVQKLQALGIESSPVPQTYGGMSAPTQALERFVKLGKLVHGGHPALRWMADNVEVLRDRSNPDNVRPVKPNREKTSKRVDGITGTIMAIDAWMRRPLADTYGVAAASGSDPGAGAGDFFRPTGRLDL